MRRQGEARKTFALDAREAKNLDARRRTIRWRLPGAKACPRDGAAGPRCLAGAGVPEAETPDHGRIPRGDGLAEAQDAWQSHELKGEGQPLLLLCSLRPNT